MAQFDFDDRPERSGRSDRRSSSVGTGFGLGCGLVFGVLAAITVIAGFLLLPNAFKKINKAAAELDGVAKVENTDKNEPKPEESIIKPNQKIVVKDVAIQVNSFEIDGVFIKPFFNEAFVKTENKYMVIKITIFNQSVNRKIDYSTWRGRLFSNSALKDNFGNNYKTIDFGIQELGNAVTRSEAIHPGKSVEDILVFEKPIDNASTFSVELKGSNVGLNTDVKFTLRNEDWNPKKPR
jgi:hypothetical protein